MCYFWLHFIAIGCSMDTLNLRRIDYLRVGATSRKCVNVLPAVADNIGQKIVVGGHNGILYCFGRKNSETNFVFKTIPGPKIECLGLGGALGSVQDKTFIATGGTIGGYSKKGRRFFSFESNMTENISSMYIYGVDMFLCGTYTFNHYHDTSETNYIVCSDKINDVLCLPVTEGSWVGRGLTPVLACNDRTIKVLQNSELAYQLEVGGTPTVLHLYQNVGGQEGSEVLYGTRDGKIGLVDLPKTAPSIRWEIATPSGSSGVSTLDCYDMTGDGNLDLIVGRDDGAVEIYTYDPNDRPQLKHSFQCNESITGLKCGRVNSIHYDEIVVCTYAGWVFGLTTEPADKELGSDLPVQKVDPESERRLQELRSEIDMLHDKVTTERFRYQEKTQTDECVSAVPLFSINDRFQLNKDEAAYYLSLELQMPIDYILIQCDVPLDLLDVDKNSAVVSLTPCSDPISGNSLLATYRCQANTTRLDIKVRSIEGQYGTLQAYVAPRLHPKTCQVKKYQIKPLSLHQRTYNFDKGRPLSHLKLSGNFSMAEIYSWLVRALPELSEKPPMEEVATFDFVSTFTGTQLEVTCKKGAGMFASDSISTIAILRDFLGKQGTKKKVKLDISCDINDACVPHMLRLLHPRLEYQLNLAKKVHMVDALKELTLNESTENFLTEEYTEILNNAEKLQSEFKSQQAHLERIYGVITDLYIDKFKFKGQDVRNKSPNLLEVLDNYNLDALLAFFNADLSRASSGKLSSVQS